MQADDIKIVDIVPETKKLMAKLDKLHQHSLIGSWKEKFSKAITKKMELSLEQFCGKRNGAQDEEISLFLK